MKSNSTGANFTKLYHRYNCNDRYNGREKPIVSKNASNKKSLKLKVTVLLVKINVVSKFNHLKLY